MGSADTEPSARGGSQPADPSGRAGLVAAELVRAQYRNIPTAVAVNAIISGLLCIALRETVSLERLGWWVCAVYAVAGARYLLWRQFNADTLKVARSGQWRRFAWLGSGVNGFTWGVGGIALYAAPSP